MEPTPRWAPVPAFRSEPGIPLEGMRHPGSGGLTGRIPVPSVFAGFSGDGRYFDVCRVDDLVCDTHTRPGTLPGSRTCSPSSSSPCPGSRSRTPRTACPARVLADQVAGEAASAAMAQYYESPSTRPNRCR